MEQQKILLADQNLDLQIEEVRQRDFSILPPIDRRLFDDEHVPKNNSTSALKKCWLFSVECAFERRSYMYDPNQTTLWDYGFATFDPV